VDIEGKEFWAFGVKKEKLKEEFLFQ